MRVDELRTVAVARNLIDTEKSLTMRKNDLIKLLQ